MVEIMPTSGPGRDMAWRRNVDRQLSALSTMRRTPFTDIYDEDGNLLGKLSPAGLEFFDTDGDPSSKLDGDGITLYGPDGQPITRLGGSGLVVYDDNGAPQLRAGNLDGSGDYGVEIGGGRARAMDVVSEKDGVINYGLTSSEQTPVTLNFAVPSWATAAHVSAIGSFQMHNPTAGVQGQVLRIDIDTPGTGASTNDVSPGRTQILSRPNALLMTAPLPSTITVGLMARVTSGTNSVNAINLYGTVIFTR